jgi:hypothetical protein
MLHGLKMRFLCVMVFCAACFAQSLAGLAQSKDIVITIDFSKPDDARKQSEILMGALSNADKKVVIDLKLVPEMIDDRPDYHAKRIPVRGGERKAKAVKCDDGWTRFGPSTASFKIDLGTVYPHLLLSILHSSPQQAPFHTAACEYAIDGPDVPVLVFRGVYAKSVINVPTAIDVELRPVAQ